MVWDLDFNDYRGVTFFEPNIPKYKTLAKCNQRGVELIQKTIFNLNEVQIKTGAWEVQCLEIKKPSA